MIIRYKNAIRHNTNFIAEAFYASSYVAEQHYNPHNNKWNF